MTLTERVQNAVEAHVTAGDLPGAAWRVVSGDEVATGVAGSHGPGTGRVPAGSLGARSDPRRPVGASDAHSPSHAPIEADTIFRLSSTTKPIVAAAAMTLIDDGTLDLDADVDRWLPELAERRVLLDPAGPIDRTEPARRPITVRDVLTFRLGLGMDLTGPWPGPVLEALGEAGLAVGPPAPQQDPPPDEWMRIVGTVPLAYQPGERWLYHTGASVLGVLIARAAGTSLPELVQQRLFTPLGMRDTGFAVPSGSLARFGPHWLPGENGQPPEEYDPTDGQWATMPAFPDAGDGLVSTVADVATFAAMVAAGGVTADGHRLLSERVVQDMLTAHVGDLDGEGGGWGLGTGVRISDETGGRHAGSYGWDGGMGSAWWTDPVSGVIAILLTNQMWTSPVPPPAFTDFWTAAFGPS